MCYLLLQFLKREVLMTDTQTKTAALINVRTVSSAFAWTTLMAALTAVASNAAFKLPFTPVPITLQVFTVILSGLVLGSRLGALSQLEYVIVGLLGAPVFAGGGSGLVHLMGPTGGYLIGFIAGSFVAGIIVEKIRSESVGLYFLASISGVMVIYLFGTSWLAVWLTMFKQTGLASSILKAWALGAAPFILVDIVKSLLAASAASGTLKLRR